MFLQGLLGMLFMISALAKFWESSTPKRR